MLKNVGVGIDLGTKFSCAAIYRDRNTEIVPTELGSRTMPSIVGYTSEERLVGETAATYQAKNPENTVFDAKRMIGRLYNDPEIQEDMKYWPFTVEQDPLLKTPVISVQFRGEAKKLAPEEISSAVLQKMKQQIDKTMKSDVKDVVITVPAYFNDAQRTSTKKAAEIVGLNVLEVLDEPTAAAITYGFGIGKSLETINVLIFDLGGGTFDVTILEIDGDKYTVKATDGDTHLGGEDFDKRLLDFVSDKFTKESGSDPRGTKRSFIILKNECERAKKTLSVSLKATIDIESLIDGKSLSIVVKREEFERINNDLFEKCLTPVQRALSIAKMDKSDITDIILVGGSSHIPKIREMISNFFDGKMPAASVDSNEAVACGAAIRASMIAKKERDSPFSSSHLVDDCITFTSNRSVTYEADTSESSESSDDESESIIPKRTLTRKPPAPIHDESDDNSDENEIILINITPLSIGVRVKGGGFQPIIKRGSVIPVSENYDFITVRDNQESIDIKIYQGERAMVDENKMLYGFKLENLPKRPAGFVRVNVAMTIDNDNIISCKASVLEEGGDSKEVQIDSKKCVLTDFQINKMANEAFIFANEDKFKSKIINKKNKLSMYVYSIFKLIRDEKFRRSSKASNTEQIKNKAFQALEIAEESFPKSSIEELVGYYKKFKTYYKNTIKEINDMVCSD